MAGSQKTPARFASRYLSCLVDAMEVAQITRNVRNMHRKAAEESNRGASAPHPYEDSSCINLTLPFLVLTFCRGLVTSSWHSLIRLVGIADRLIDSFCSFPWTDYPVLRSSLRDFL